MTHRCTLHVEIDDPGDLAAVVAAVEGLGHAVECPVFDEWSRLRARDELLREAHAFMSGTPWGKSLRLAAEVQRFDSIIWPRIRGLETPPEGSKLRALLFRARRLGPLPTTARHLWNIAKCQGPGDFSEGCG